METIVDEPSWVRRGSWIGCPAVGAGLLVGLYALSGWVVSLPWFPVQGPFRLVNSIPAPWGLLGAIALGLVLGLVFASLWATERLVVTLTPEMVTLERGDKKRRYEARLSAVYVEDKQLVLIASDGRVLAREKTDLGAEDLGKAFTEHGHPWLAEPPPVR
ncbi:YqeB family protein [Amycolatopsis sp. H20-H5]|uniref:YqeB family protein n=1 Tax=Amycolatopsis sp. H20-H5 TaxID=3046309 RepID=UPI002DBAA397|nr:hypothetical protein [Amycolatopsis sp. H20-H5]MEC3982159.1 hypothetical protein [Amycolatopsis sp. H20-H5]